jgi:plastocyanin
MFVAAGIIAIAAMVATLLPMRASSSGTPATAAGPRRIKLVVRDMAFYVDGTTEPNPTLAFKAGELVELHLRNDEPGMRHDFAVKAWDVATRLLEDRGEEDTITFRVPEIRGTTAYICTPHAKMMSGTLRIE